VTSILVISAILVYW